MTRGIELAERHLGDIEQKHDELFERMNEALNAQEDAEFDELYELELYLYQQVMECGCEDCIRIHLQYRDLVIKEEQRLSPTYYGDELREEV